MLGSSVGGLILLCPVAWPTVIFCTCISLYSSVLCMEVLILIVSFIVHTQVYWSQLEPPRIMRAVLDGSREDTLIQTSISLPESLAVDPYSENLYWVDSNLDKIEVYGLKSERRKVLVNTGLKPQGLALDLRNRYVSDLYVYPCVCLCARWLIKIWNGWRTFNHFKLLVRSLVSIL